MFGFGKPKIVSKSTGGFLERNTDKKSTKLIKKMDRQGYDLVGSNNTTPLLGLGKKSHMVFKKRERKSWFR